MPQPLWQSELPCRLPSDSGFGNWLAESESGQSFRNSWAQSSPGFGNQLAESECGSGLGNLSAESESGLSFGN